MADYYTQYSETVPGTSKQIEWLIKRFEEHEEDSEWPELGSYQVSSEELWIHDNEGGADIGQIADLLHEYLAHFDLDFELSISWANTCSKPRIGSFSGGAVAINKKEVVFCSDPLKVAKDKLFRGAWYRTVP